jgi:hypothetical protein
VQFSAKVGTAEIITSVVDPDLVGWAIGHHILADSDPYPSQP